MVGEVLKQSEKPSAVDGLTEGLTNQPIEYKKDVGNLVADTKPIPEKNTDQKESADKAPEYFLPESKLINATNEFIAKPMNNIPEANIKTLQEKGITLNQEQIKSLIDKVMNLKDATTEQEKEANKTAVKDVQNVVQYFYPPGKTCSHDGGFGPNTGYAVLKMLGTAGEKMDSYKSKTEKMINDNRDKYYERQKKQEETGKLDAKDKKKGYFTRPVENKENIATK